jgi:hypothetical protein
MAMKMEGYQQAESHRVSYPSTGTQRAPNLREIDDIDRWTDHNWRFGRFFKQLFVCVACCFNLGNPIFKHSMCFFMFEFVEWPYFFHSKWWGRRTSHPWKSLHQPSNPTGHSIFSALKWGSPSHHGFQFQY